MATDIETVSFDEFKVQWLQSVKEGSPSTRELGRRFAHKLFTQWLDTNDDDITYCDGAGDGGIDIAYLDRASDHEGTGEEAAGGGDTWYLVQSKYGLAFRGTNTLLEEGQKVIDTLDGKRAQLSSLAHDVFEKLTLFRKQAVSEVDSIVLLFATENALTEDQKRAMDDLRAMGGKRLGSLFSVDTISVETIFRRQMDDQEAARLKRIRLPIDGTLTPSGEGLLVGAIPLKSLYNFLKAYRNITQDLDQLYEKNVRRFLGSRGRVNKGIQQTLYKEPQNFGLYNNGIAIVAEDFQDLGDGRIELIEPFIVNGCQTTRSIWTVFENRLGAGGSGTNPEMETWREDVANGVVITKIAKVGAHGEDLLQNITRFTNSQNAVREKDFVGLSSDFRAWSRQMAERFDVFLEVQRGGWDSRRAWQAQHPTDRQFTQSANAFDLLKVYGAGWLREAGSAYGRNAAFLPNGTIFKRVLNEGSTSEGESDAEHESFGVDDLYAAFRLQSAADAMKFGRGADMNSRKQTRFLFYLSVIELLRDVLVHAGLQPTPKNFTRNLTRLFNNDDQAPANALMNIAVNMIDTYMTEGADYTAFREPAFRDRFNNDLNGYLKWEALGKTDDSSPNYRTLLGITRASMAMAMTGPSPRELMVRVITT